MRFLLDKITKLEIGWNERPLTEADFHSLCKRFDVRVIETPLHTSGFYFRLMGRDVIAVDCKLSGTSKLAVLFHELGHFLFHIPESGPTAKFHNVDKKTRQEIEADVFAHCAIIPRIQIENLATLEPSELNTVSGELVAARFEILRRYDI